MQKTKIEWTDETWNPVTGCLHTCRYCYARRIARRFGKTPEAKRFEPELHQARLDGPIKKRKPRRIFVCSMADLFGEWVSREWIEQVLDVVRICPQHTFQFLTKNPHRYLEFEFPENVWLGASTTNQEQADRAVVMRDIPRITYVSAEPMLGPVRLNGFSPDWVIIGAQTGPGGRQPEEKWVQDLILNARARGAALFFKPNLEWPYEVREFPRHTVCVTRDWGRT